MVSATNAYDRRYVVLEPVEDRSKTVGAVGASIDSHLPSVAPRWGDICSVKNRFDVVNVFTLCKVEVSKETLTDEFADEYGLQ